MGNTASLEHLEPLAAREDSPVSVLRRALDEAGLEYRATLYRGAGVYTRVALGDGYELGCQQTGAFGYFVPEDYRDLLPPCFVETILQRNGELVYRDEWGYPDVRRFERVQSVIDDIVRLRELVAEAPPDDNPAPINQEVLN